MTQTRHDQTRHDTTLIPRVRSKARGQTPRSLARYRVMSNHRAHGSTDQEGPTAGRGLCGAEARAIAAVMSKHSHLRPRSLPCGCLDAPSCPTDPTCTLPAISTPSTLSHLSSLPPSSSSSASSGPSTLHTNLTAFAPSLTLPHASSELLPSQASHALLPMHLLQQTAHSHSSLPVSPHTPPSHSSAPPPRLAWPSLGGSVLYLDSP